MARQLYFKFVKENVKGIVDLHEDLAPVTTKLLWKALAKPIRDKAFHAAFAGPEIMVGLPKSAQNFDPTKLPAENQTVRPGKGDCLFYYQAKNSMKGLSFELWEMGMFYDNGGSTFGPLGWTPVNIYGVMSEGIDAFAECCRDIRMSGAKELEIGRVGR